MKAYGLEKLIGRKAMWDDDEETVEGKVLGVVANIEMAGEGEAYTHIILLVDPGFDGGTLRYVDACEVRLVE